MRLSATKNGAISTGRGLGNELWDKAGTAPSLDLQFADNKSLADATTGSDLVTFTRASSGTYVDSEGVIRTARTNLLLRSEEFNNAYWTKTNSSTTQDAIAAPNGTITAEKLLTDTTSSIHAVRRDETVLASTNYTLSFYAKAAEYTFLFINHGHTLVAGYLTFFDLSTGTVGTNAAGNTASIQSVGNGWYRCSVTRTTAVSQTSLSARAGACQSDNVDSFVGDTASGIYIWGAQLEQSSTVGEYIPTTSTINSAPRFDHNPTTGESLGLLVEEQRTNLMLQSEDFSTTWSVNGSASIATNTIASPASTLTADTLTVSGGGANRVSQSYSVPSAGTYTLSVYAKAGTGNLLQLRQFLSGNDAYVIFNFTTGVMGVVSGGTSASATATALPNGWYRLVLTNTYSGAATINIRIGGAVGSSETNTTFYLWGAQVEAGAFATSYIPTTTAAVTRNADVASITGSAFSGWYNSTAGTMRSQWVGAVNGCRSFHCEDAGQTNTERFGQRITSNLLQTEVGSNGVLATRLASGAGTVTYPAIITSCAAYDATNCVVAFRGDVSVTATANGAPECGQIFIGSYRGTGTFANGPIARLTYWPQLFPSSTLSVLAP
jgi:hypothetical protein